MSDPKKRMSRCALTAALAFIVAAPLWADAKPKPNTLLLGDLDTGVKLWLMLDSVKSDQATIRHGWSVIDYLTPQTSHGVSFRSDASKFYVNCKTRQIDLANAIKFSGSMGAGKNVFQVNSEPTPEPDAADYHLIRPGTAEEAVADAICKQKIR